jgi:hypothetical protein
MTGSVKQSTERQNESWIASSLTLLAMTAGHSFATSRLVSPELCWKFPCPPIRGRREYRVRAAPTVSCATVHKKTHTSIQVQRRQSGIPCAMVLTVSFVLSPATGLSCHRHPRKMLPANLMPASGHQDHTTSPSASSAFVKGAIRVHRVPSRVCDDRETPLFRDGMANHIA